MLRNTKKWDTGHLEHISEQRNVTIYYKRHARRFSWSHSWYRMATVYKLIHHHSTSPVFSTAIFPRLFFASTLRLLLLSVLRSLFRYRFSFFFLLSIHPSCMVRIMHIILEITLAQTHAHAPGQLFFIIILSLFLSPSLSLSPSLAPSLSLSHSTYIFPSSQSQSSLTLTIFPSFFHLPLIPSHSQDARTWLK